MRKDLQYQRQTYKNKTYLETEKTKQKMSVPIPRDVASVRVERVWFCLSKPSEIIQK